MMSNCIDFNELQALSDDMMSGDSKMEDNSDFVYVKAQDVRPAAFSNERKVIVKDVNDGLVCLTTDESNLVDGYLKCRRMPRQMIGHYTVSGVLVVAIPGESSKGNDILITSTDDVKSDKEHRTKPYDPFDL